MSIGDRIRNRRKELGWTQKVLTDKIGYKDLSTLSKIERGEIELSQSKIMQFAEVLGVSAGYLMEIKGCSDQHSTRSNDTSRSIFAENLRFYIGRSGKTQKEIAEIVGVSAPTFTAYVKGEKYPRIEKIEILADFFGVTMADLIERRTTTDSSPGNTRCSSNPENYGNKDAITFARRLNIAMAITNTSRADLIRATGIDQGAMTNYLAGRYKPKQPSLVKLAQALKVSELWLGGISPIDEIFVSATAFGAGGMMETELLSICKRLSADPEYFEIVNILNGWDIDRLRSLKLILKPIND